jgi:general secretion pathway protein A
MYCEFFGFSERPFKPSPDPSFLYLSPCHEEALRGIICGIYERQGLLSITGEVGTGKTTVLYTALHWLSEKTRTAFVPNYNLQFGDLLLLILSELKIATLSERSSKLEGLDKLKTFAIEQMSAGYTVAIIVDEAQNLSKDDLENVRLLSNLETPSNKLLQIILSGQPELDQKLEDPNLRQIKQRLFRRFHIEPLSPDLTSEYIKHRMRLVSDGNGDLFDRSICDEIWL